MPEVKAARRRDARKSKQPTRRFRMSGQALKANRQARHALEARYGGKP